MLDRNFTLLNFPLLRLQIFWKELQRLVYQCSKFFLRRAARPKPSGTAVHVSGHFGCAALCSHFQRQWASSRQQTHEDAKTYCISMSRTGSQQRVDRTSKTERYTASAFTNFNETTISKTTFVSEVPYRLVYKTHFFAPKLNIKRGGMSYT